MHGRLRNLLFNQVLALQDSPVQSHQYSQQYNLPVCPLHNQVLNLVEYPPHSLARILPLSLLRNLLHSLRIRLLRSHRRSPRCSRQVNPQHNQVRFRQLCLQVSPPRNPPISQPFSRRVYQVLSPA